MDKPFIELSGSFHKHPYDIANVDNYAFPENFPNCCTYHRSLLSQLNEWFQRFPECCEAHKKLKEAFWFKKSDFTNLPEKLVRQITFSDNHFILNANKTDWKEEFADYIGYNIDSLGAPAIGDDRYLNSLRHFLNNSTDAENLSGEQKEYLLKLIDSYFAPRQSTGEHETTNFTTLFEVWQNWLKIFPFQLSIFAELKEHFSKQLPFIKGEVKVNRYTGIATAQMQTTSSLVEVIVNLTKSLLSKVDSFALFSSDQISEKITHQLDLLNESHRVKQLQLLTDFTNDETKYILIIDSWLHNEKDYFKEIVSIHSSQIALQQTNVKPSTKTPSKSSDETIKIKKELKEFADIFVNSDWRKFISALEKSDPKLINSNWEFIGKPRSHKGVICSWISYLQSKGEINGKINRSELANVLNNEIKYLDIGKDGKTFTNFSKLFDSDFKDILINLSK